MSLPSKLVDKSLMTKRQLDSLEAYLGVKSGAFTLREAAESAPGHHATVGSYYRTMNQARNNLRKSVVTLLIGLWLGAVKLEDVKRMFELVALGTRELSDAEVDRMVQVIDALLNRMVV